LRKHPVEAQVITGERIKFQRARDRKRKNDFKLDLTSMYVCNIKFLIYINKR